MDNETNNKIREFFFMGGARASEKFARTEFTTIARKLIGFMVNREATDEEVALAVESHCRGWRSQRPYAVFGTTRNEVFKAE